MPRVTIEGLGTVEFPEGTSPEDMERLSNQALMEKNTGHPATGMPEGTAAPDPITGNHELANKVSLWEGLKGAGKGVLGTIHAIHDFNAPSDPRNSMYVNQDKYPGSDINTKASNPDQMAGKVAETGLEMLGGGEGVADALPSASRAGQVFRSIESQAAKTPVSLNKASDPILELYDLANTGSNPPKAVRQLLNRATQPNGNPILYPEARKFASRISNSSIAERLTSDPNMKRVLGSLREAFNGDVGDAAASVGRGEDYQKAMQEFASAKKLQRVGAATGAAAASGLGIGAKLGVLGHILGNITGGQ